MKVQNSNRSIYQRLMTLLLLLSSSIIVVVLSSQEYDYAEDYGDYQQRGDYYGEQDMDGGYYTQEGDVAGDTLYHDYARHQQYKAGGLWVVFCVCVCECVYMPGSLLCNRDQYGAKDCLCVIVVTLTHLSLSTTHRHRYHH